MSLNLYIQIQTIRKQYFQHIKNEDILFKQITYKPQNRRTNIRLIQIQFCLDIGQPHNKDMDQNTKNFITEDYNTDYSGQFLNQTSSNQNQKVVNNGLIQNGKSCKSKNIPQIQKQNKHAIKKINQMYYFAYRFSLDLIKNMKHEFYEYLVQLVQLETNTKDKQLPDFKLFDPLTILQANFFEKYEKIMVQNLLTQLKQYQDKKQSQDYEYYINEEFLAISQISQMNQKLRKQINIIKLTQEQLNQFSASTVKNKHVPYYQSNNFQGIVAQIPQNNLFDLFQKQGIFQKDQKLLLENKMEKNPQNIVVNLERFSQSNELTFNMCLDCLKYQRIARDTTSKKALKDQLQNQQRKVKQLNGLKNADKQMQVSLKDLMQSCSQSQQDLLENQILQQVLQQHQQQSNQTNKKSQFAHRQLQFIIRQKQVQKRLQQTLHQLEYTKNLLEGKQDQLLRTQNQWGSKIRVLQKQNLQKNRQQRVKQIKQKIQREGMKRQFGLQRQRDGMHFLIQKQNICSNLIVETTKTKDLSGVLKGKGLFLRKSKVNE